MRRGNRRGRPGSALRNDRGLTFVEVMAVASVSIAVVIAAAVAYQGTVRSWRGTAALSNLQRDASLAIEFVQNTVRGASRVAVGSGGDSLNVYYDTASGESLAGRFYLDGSGCIRDINGTALADGVDSLNFAVEGGGVVHINVDLSDDVGTPNRCTDDQGVLMSSTAICRN